MSQVEVPTVRTADQGKALPQPWVRKRGRRGRPVRDARGPPERQGTAGWEQSPLCFMPLAGARNTPEGSTPGERSLEES